MPAIPQLDDTDPYEGRSPSASAGPRARAHDPHFERADVDNTAWDGGAAMSGCANSDTPASCYGSICAGKKAGDTALQSSWALPHHKSPGAPPNAAGVANSLSRLPQTDGLTNAAAAKSHLEAHMKAINPDYDTNALASGKPGTQRRALSLGDRHMLAGDGAARVEAFRAQYRSEPVVLNGKDMIALDGYASVVGVEYEMWDMFGPYGETIHPAAFDQTLAADPDVAFLVNHKGLTMARTANGTLQLNVDPRGLHSLAYVNPARSDVHDLLTAIDDKNVTEMSFAFMINDGEWDEEYEHFTILSVDIDRGDVSAVNYGANPYTSIAARQRQILAEIRMLPDGPARAALGELADRFGGVLVGDRREGGLRELSRASAFADPVREVATGRSTALVQTLLDADL